jgi:hypothetical protein
MNNFNINTNFTAYKNCENSLDYALNSFCSSKTSSIFENNLPSKTSGGSSAASRRLKNLFRSIDQKITLIDVATSQNNFSSNVTNKATDLLVELRENNDPFKKQEIMDKVDNFFANVKKGDF